MVIASRERAFTPEALRATGKPTLLAQAGIHAGEIDGKDAGLMLLRDMTVRGTRKDLLDRANLLFIPILNVDGHERSSAFSRINQRGPVEMGWRTNARNLNLNRDYAKLDAVETRAVVSAINAWSPDLYYDLHVTDGIDYQYDVTFGDRRRRGLARHRGLDRRHAAARGHRRPRGRGPHPGAAGRGQPGRSPRPREGHRRLPARGTLLHRLRRLSPPAHGPGGEPLAEAVPAARARHVRAAREHAAAPGAARRHPSARPSPRTSRARAGACPSRSRPTRRRARWISRASPTRSRSRRSPAAARSCGRASPPR